MKTCFKCGKEKPLDDFYAHPAMADGRLGKCKSCARADVSRNRALKHKQYAEYERKRAKDPQRKAKVSEYAKTTRKRHPLKRFAWSAVSNAVRDKKLKRQACEVCGNPKSQAHHEDYSKPLAVRWLCFKHHREIGHGQNVAS